MDPPLFADSRHLPIDCTIRVDEPTFTAGDFRSSPLGGNGISVPQSRKVTDPLPRGNADPLDPLLATGVVPPPGGNSAHLTALQTDTARQRSAQRYAGDGFGRCLDP